MYHFLHFYHLTPDKYIFSFLLNIKVEISSQLIHLYIFIHILFFNAMPLAMD